MYQLLLLSQKSQFEEDCFTLQQMHDKACLEKLRTVRLFCSM